MSGTLPPAQTDGPSQDPIPPAVRAAAAQAVPTQSPSPTPQPQSQTAPAPSPTQQPQSQTQQPQSQTQGVPTTVARSDPAQRPDMPLIDPRPYASLAEHAPQYRAMVDHAADETGVDPARLAWHWFKEGGFQTQVSDGKAGEKGPLQVMPTTAQMYDKNGKLDPTKLEDGLVLAGRIINHADSRFGKNTPSSVAAYQGGEGSAAAIATNPDTASRDHPTTLAYVQSAFPGQQVTSGHFTKPMDMDPRTLVQSASQGGPDGFLRYVAQTAQQSGTSMSDAMRSAEATLVGFAASRGDYAGMQHARDFVLQVAHSGSNQYLMAAHQALQVGDGQSAAQYMAKAHAFFPDGTMGKFGVDGKGQLWGQRMDETQPTKALGQPFRVKPDDVMSLMNQTRDPGKYLQMVQEQQKTAASIRHTNAMGDYYGNLLDSRERIAGQTNDTKRDIAGEHDDARRYTADQRYQGQVDSAAIRAQNRQGTGPSAKLSAQADKEAATNFNDLAMPGADPSTLGKLAETFHDVRMSGVTEPQALAVTKGIHSGNLQLVRGQDGRYGVMDPKDKSGQPIAILSQSVGDRLAGNAGVKAQGGAVPGAGQAPNSTPVGAGASTAMARATGVTNNMSGTVNPQQSSALPVSQ